MSTLKDLVLAFGQSALIQDVSKGRIKTVVEHCVDCGDDRLQCRCPGGPVVVWSAPAVIELSVPVAPKPEGKMTVTCMEGHPLSEAQDWVCTICGVK